MKVTILTLGCKVNQAESADIEGNLIKHGITIVGLSEKPDYCVINTCTVTAKSDYQSRQLVRRAVKAGARVIVTGCYSQIRPEEIRKIEGEVDIVANANKSQIINILSNNIKSKRLCFSLRSRPYVKVQDGCNNACTYCIVPKARGRSRSVNISEVVNQAIEFEKEGYHEIVLTGIHLGSYGFDFFPKKKLSDLIITLLKQTTIQRIRLSSIEVNEIDNDIIDLLHEKRLCKHVHIPLQSGDDNILKNMNRKYTVKDYNDVIEKIKNKIPNIAIGTDVIAGFPGEGDKEYENTKYFIDSLPLSYIHIFPFSSRPHTKASQMPIQIASAVKKERVNDLKLLHIRKKKMYMDSQIHEILDVIIEEKDNDNCSIGTSSNYLKIKVYDNCFPRKSQVYVSISGIEGDVLRGIPISKL